MAKILKPHGIQGECKVFLYNKDSNNFTVGLEVWLILGEELISCNIEKINSVKKEIKFVALKLVEIDAKMLDLLAMKKEEIVKGLCVHSDNNTRDKSIRSSGKQLIDITLD